MERQLRLEKEPTKETGEEREKETEYVEVSEEVLEEIGWKYYQRTDGHVFTILIPQILDPKRSFERGFVYAKHQMKSMSGELLPGVHRDHLIKEGIQDRETMNTEYDPQIDHTDYTVLEKIYIRAF
jgi:hypothetical protein